MADDMELIEVQVTGALSSTGVHSGSGSRVTL